MRSMLPWLRTLLSLPAGVVAIELFHRLAELVVPHLYAGEPANTADRLGLLLVVVFAGIAGSFSVAFIARHRLWLHMGLLLVVMVLIDVQAIRDYFPAQPAWFKAAIFLTMPLQLYLGARLARWSLPGRFTSAVPTGKADGAWAPVSRPGRLAWLVALLLAGVWFLANELAYAIARDRAGESPVRTVALIGHLLLTLPLLLLPILQFSRRIRQRWPAWHRRAGWVYLTCAMGAATLAIYLGLTFDSLGRRVPVTLFAVVWLLFSAAALVCARRRLFAAHEQFVIRSYAIALAFVFVRVMGEMEDALFAFLPDPQLRGVTREWLCFVLPLLAVEAYNSWWPALRLRQVAAGAPAKAVPSGDSP